MTEDTGDVSGPRVYPEARVERVVSGHSLQVVVSNLDVDVHLTVRVEGIDTAPMSEVEGRRAAEWLRWWCTQAGWAVALVIRKTRAGSPARATYGTWLASVWAPPPGARWVPSGESLADAMVKAGRAEYWPGWEPQCAP